MNNIVEAEQTVSNNINITEMDSTFLKILLNNLKDIVEDFKDDKNVDFSRISNWLDEILNIQINIGVQNQSIRDKFEKIIPSSMALIIACLQRKPINDSNLHNKLLSKIYMLLSNVYGTTIKKLNYYSNIKDCFWRIIDVVGDYNTQMIALNLLTMILKCANENEQEKEIDRICGLQRKTIKENLYSIINVSSVHNGIIEKISRKFLNSFNKTSQNIKVYSFCCESFQLGGIHKFYKPMTSTSFWIDLNYIPKTLTLKGLRAFQTNLTTIKLTLKISKIKLENNLLIIYYKPPVIIFGDTTNNEDYNDFNYAVIELSKYEIFRLSNNNLLFNYFNSENVDLEHLYRKSINDENELEVIKKSEQRFLRSYQYLTPTSNSLHVSNSKDSLSKVKVNETSIYGEMTPDSDNSILTSSNNKESVGPTENVNINKNKKNGNKRRYIDNEINKENMQIMNSNSSINLRDGESFSKMIKQKNKNLSIILDKIDGKEFIDISGSTSYKSIGLQNQVLTNSETSNNATEESPIELSGIPTVRFQENLNCTPNVVDMIPPPKNITKHKSEATVLTMEKIPSTEELNNFKRITRNHNNKSFQNMTSVNKRNRRKKKSKNSKKKTIETNEIEKCRTENEQGDEYEDHSIIVSQSRNNNSEESHNEDLVQTSNQTKETNGFNNSQTNININISPRSDISNKFGTCIYDYPLSDSGESIPTYHNFRKRKSANMTFNSFNVVDGSPSNSFNQIESELQKKYSKTAVMNNDTNNNDGDERDDASTNNNTTTINNNINNGIPNLFVNNYSVDTSSVGNICPEIIRNPTSIDNYIGTDKCTDNDDDDESNSDSLDSHILVDKEITYNTNHLNKFVKQAKDQIMSQKPIKSMNHNIKTEELNILISTHKQILKSSSKKMTTGIHKTYLKYIKKDIITSCTQVLEIENLMQKEINNLQNTIDKISGELNSCYESYMEISSGLSLIRNNWKTKLQNFKKTFSNESINAEIANARNELKNLSSYICSTNWINFLKKNVTETDE